MNCLFMQCAYTKGQCSIVNEYISLMRSSVMFTILECIKLILYDLTLIV